MANHLPYFNTSSSSERVHPSEHYSARGPSIGRGRPSFSKAPKPENYPDSSAETVRSISPDPLFDRHTEATNIELFYDLFFVANLTVFSSVKEVNDGKTLSQYIGFFCILWFTWYQVSLYDVRFAKDTVFDRIAKVIQFGVMVGFAVNGPKFNPGENVERLFGVTDSLTVIADPRLTTYKSLTLLMMVSRLTLVGQYLQAMWISRARPSNIFPISLIVGTELVAAAIYGLLFIAFQRLHPNAYITWYVVAFMETIICTTVSAVWRNISFKGTHLVQRMGLLTLIILGEGVMGLSHMCQNLVKAQIFTFSGSTISDVACVVLIIYFLYMLYFDWVQEHHMGTIRQQIWAFLHFPMHLALVLTVTGANQFVAWRAGTARADKLYDELTSVFTSNSTSYDDIIRSIQDTQNGVITNGIYKGAHNIGQFLSYQNANESITAGLAAIQEAIDNNDKDEINTGIELVLGSIVNAVYTAVGFEPPHAADLANHALQHGISNEEAQEEAQNESLGLLKISKLTFIYFFVTIGAYVIISGIIAWISKRDKNLGDKVRLIIRFIVGFLLCATSMASIHTTDKFGDFVNSPWILPSATLGLLLVIVLNNLPCLNRKDGNGLSMHKRKTKDIDE